MSMTVKKQPAGWTVTIDPGTYFLGDPCYVVPRAEWKPLLESFGPFQDQPVGLTPSGHEVLAFGTAYGDGDYVDQNGRVYVVDGAMIGLTPAALFEGKALEKLSHLGQIVVFIDATECATDGEGRLRFGDYRIDTNEDEESWEQ